LNVIEVRSKQVEIDILLDNIRRDVSRDFPFPVVVDSSSESAGVASFQFLLVLIESSLKSCDRHFGVLLVEDCLEVATCSEEWMIQACIYTPRPSLPNGRSM
jgi:hypothetical protein